MIHILFVTDLNEKMKKTFVMKWQGKFYIRINTTQLLVHLAEHFQIPCALHTPRSLHPLCSFVQHILSGQTAEKSNFNTSPTSVSNERYLEIIIEQFEHVKSVFHRM
jgi:hypothetical protein